MRFSARADRAWGPSSLLQNGYRFFSGGRGGRSVGLIPHPHLECRGPRKSRAIPLLTLRAFVAYKKGRKPTNILWSSTAIIGQSIQYIVKVKWFRYRPGVAQRVGRGIALLFRDRGTRKGWVVSSTLRPHFTPGKDPVPILHEAGWAPGPVWTAENLVSTGLRSRTVQPVAQSLYRLSYRAHHTIL